MSNVSYERFGKLQAALGKIVYDDRRHLESVCAVLQGLVFDKLEWPKSKDWHAIRIVAIQNPAMAAMLANLNLDTKDQTTQQIVAAFPQCFREEAVPGPVPLSCIRAMAIRNGKDSHKSGISPDEKYTDDYLSQFPQSYGVLEELNLPYTIYRTSEEANAGSEDFPFLPSDVDPLAPQGSVVRIESIAYVVVENNQNSGVHEMVLVDSDFVDHTC